MDYWLKSGEDIRDLLLASVKPGDAHALYSIIREKRPAVILEVGTFVGFSTCIMAQAVTDNGFGEIHCIDPNIPHLSVKTPLKYANDMLRRLKLEPCVRMHEGYFSEPHNGGAANAPVLGKSAAELLPPIDLAFIDGDHSTHALLQDFMLVLPCLRGNATVLFHDTRSWHSVRQGVQTIMSDETWRSSMQYFEFSPSGFDGLSAIEIRK